jgi:hypothetical protein
MNPVDILDFQKLALHLRLFCEFTEQRIVFCENLLLCLRYAFCSTHRGCFLGWKRNRCQPNFKVLKLRLHSGKFSFQLLKSIQKYLDWLFVVSCNHTYTLPEFDSSSSRILNPAFTS